VPDAPRAEGARVILVGRDPDRLQKAAAEVDAASTAAFDLRKADCSGRSLYAQP
jgi:NADP-dependent 3-hydroxy acid dehydrogenase YdfG